MNITDVGHLVSDADEGEDKMLVAARREKKSSHELAEFYTKIFLDHCSWLNIKRPDTICKATEHIQEMIELIKRLEQRGMAYQAGGNVYFEVQKFPQYGDLAKLDLEKLQAGARIDVDANKRHPLDFALWFTNSKFENQELQWDSPWGRGYPGWHIECSAMSMKYLGEQFDIHCGGIDHIPVHHTNEIAQSQGATQRPLANVWMHGGFLLADKEKMSKSKGEFLTLDVVKNRGVDPLAYRMFCLGGYYRNELTFSWEALENAARGLKKLQSTVNNWKQSCSGTPEAVVNANVAAELRNRFEAAIFDDLGVAKAMSVVHEMSQESSLSEAERLAIMLCFDEVLGLGVASWSAAEADVPPEVWELAEKRKSARAEKDFRLADELRDKIAALGYTVEDGPSGMKVKRS